MPITKKKKKKKKYIYKKSIYNIYIYIYKMNFHVSCEVLGSNSLIINLFML